MPDTTKPRPVSTDFPVLGRIANAMKQMARERAALPDPGEASKPVRHIFERGARIYLWFLPAGTETMFGGEPLHIESDQWKLAVARDGVFPSETEMKTFRAAFGIGSLFFSDIPQMWTTPSIPAAPPVTRYAYVLRWFAREERVL